MAMCDSTLIVLLLFHSIDTVQNICICNSIAVNADQCPSVFFLTDPKRHLQCQRCELFCNFACLDISCVPLVCPF